MPVDGRAHATVDGGLDLGDGRVISAHDITLRATTSGGPGGQHANRTMSRVVATLDVAHAESLREADRALLLQRMGHVISAASSSDRGQARNRALALEQLARKVAIGLYVEPPRRATRPTRASVTRRLEGKRHRATIKDARRRRDDD